MRWKQVIGACVATALMVPTTAISATPSDVRDLVGARGPGGEDALQQRGYTHIKTDKGDDRAWSYWWNGTRKQCLSIVVKEGRFDTITDSPSVDCNQKAANANSTATAVAAGVAAAALIGALALSHKSHNHDSKTHYDDDKSEAAYERGYRDGLYNQSYHNYDRSDPYSRGYEAGVQQRGYETSYRDDHHSGSSAGYRASVDVSDLNGIRASSADSEMQNRGFANVDGLKSGTTSYTIWYNPQTRQCMQMGVADGRVVNLVDIHKSPKCDNSAREF